MSLSVSPFSLQLPTGYALAPASATTTTPATAPTADVVSIGRNADAGSFTADAGDTYSLSSLFKASAPSGSSIADYRVALGDGGGTLTLNGTDVSAQTSFTAAQFAQLTYTAGATGTQQAIVVAAESGKAQANGTLTGIADSPAEQVTADVTGTRSLAATAALAVTPTGTDSNQTNVINLVKETAVFSGLGSAAPPTVRTAGNFTAEAGDVYNLSNLFQGSAPTGSSVAGYRVALGDGGGTLTLNGVDVSTQTSFTAAQFAQLTYTAGPTGSAQDIVVAAQTGKASANGTLTGKVDSSAVQISASVTGTRSLNAAAALTTTPSGTDSNETNVISLVHETGAFSGLGGTATRPTLSATGNFTAQAGDIYNMSDLFHASAPTGSAIAGYRVALSDGGGTLTLNGVDVSTQTSFTAAQFAQLTYTAGPTGSQQDLVVAARTGKAQANGTLTGIVDSSAVQVTADVTGDRSLNAAAALTATPAGTDTNTANVIGLVRESGIFSGLGASTSPSLTTAGNFTAVAGDTYNMADLFQGSAPKGASIAGYRVALGDGGGQLWLNGVNVSAQTSFTAAQFADLAYVAGSQGTQQSLVVAAQTGTTLANGTLTAKVDSPAEAITADVTGARSINAIAALASTPSGTDTNQTNVINLVKETSVFTGLGTAAPPTMATAGNFTAQAGDVYNMSSLFQGKAPTGSSVAQYRVALGDGGGTLTLNGVDVSSQTSFTAAQFAELTYTAGTNGSSQDIVVAAQTGKTLGNGTLTGIVDSPAVKITANVGSARSMNADAALTTTPAGTDSNESAVIGLIHESAVFSGLSAGGTPTLRTSLAPQLPNLAVDLSTSVGAYAVSGVAAGSAVALSAYDPTAIGGSSSSGAYSDPGAALAHALLLLNATATGAFQTANLRLTQSQAIAAYSASQAL